MTSAPAEKTGAQIIANALIAHNVKIAFCVPGESYLDILDALYDAREDIHVTTCRHENGAAFMAEAYAKLTHRPAVAFVTRGPGACNASIATHTAVQDSTPMVLLVGHVRREDIGREAFQEVDFEQMFAPLSKAVRMIEHAQYAARDVAWAFATAAQGRPGPVVLVLPEDMLRERAPDEPVAPCAPVPEVNPGNMERLHHLLKQAERPLVVVGGGGWTDQARADMKTFIENNDLPVCCSFRRLDTFDNGHRCFAGELGIGPNPRLLQRIAEADLLLVVGARLGEMTSQAYTLLGEEEACRKLVHVQSDATELGRVFSPVLGITATAEAFAHAAAKLAAVNGPWNAWREQAHADYEFWKRPQDLPGRLDLGACMKWLDDALDDDAIIAIDAGNFSGWAQRHLTHGGARRFLGPTNGAMGYGVPAGIAALSLDPNRQVVVFVGDGGFGMTGQEIATAVAEGLAPIILVFNNATFGTIRMHQEKRFPGRVIATDLVNPDYPALARAYGAYGDTVESAEQFPGAFESARASGRVALIELRYDVNLISTRTTLDAIRGAGEAS